MGLPARCILGKLGVGFPLDRGFKGLLWACLRGDGLGFGVFVGLYIGVHEGANEGFMTV